MIYLNVKKHIIIIGILWSAVILTSFVLNYSSTLKEQPQLAFLTARSFFQQVVITRKWNAQHGGVYVPVTETTLPNPYLKILDRDIQINPGLTLTKINPAYMTRQMSDIAQSVQGVQFHITSLNPIRPENQATKRETSYFNQFENGILEGGEFFKKNKSEFYFFMAPLITEKSCLKCHGQQGYKEGDIRGGISVTMPFEADMHLSVMLITHVAIALLGLIGLGFVERKLSASCSIIKQQAIMDALTEIPNRRSFSERILQAFRRSKRESEPLSLIMCDIDNFKKFNDRYGHTAGDNCLKEVAMSLKASVKRSGDFCARYGGEEFVVILVDTDLSGALKVAERIHSGINELQIKHCDSPPAGIVTISMGVATLNDTTLDSHEALIQHADEALYRAKKAGRNQIKIYQE